MGVTFDKDLQCFVFDFEHDGAEGASYLERRQCHNHFQPYRSQRLDG